MGSSGSTDANGSDKNKNNGNTKQKDNNTTDNNNKNNNNTSSKKDNSKNKDAAAANPLAPPSSTTQQPSAVDDKNNDPQTTFLGKEKYIMEYGSVALAVESRSVTQDILLAFVPTSTEHPNGKQGLTFACRTGQGTLFAKEMLDDEALEAEKTIAGISHPWHVFFKSIASDLLKGRARLQISADKAVATFKIANSKDSSMDQPFSVKLLPVKMNHQNHARLILMPMVSMVQKKRALGKGQESLEKEHRLSVAETKISLHKILAAQHTEKMRKQNAINARLRDPAAEIVRKGTPKAIELQKAERKVGERRVGLRRNRIDYIYETGGAVYFRHLDVSPAHFPDAPPLELMAKMQSWINAAFPLRGSNSKLQTIGKIPSDPSIRNALNASDSDVRMAEGILTAMQSIDQWDYNVFNVEEASGGNALFCTTYAILMKLDLVSHFQINPTTLRNFLGAVQSGYHPNPYHNKSHAADVTQINYFILTQAGLKDKCKLSKEELLGAILSGAIHDYDHPGFNNNFHSKTNAYLSTLYNDRSILENHHVACVYEILRKDEFNIFAHLKDEQKRLIRETIVEMVLSTDMGLHQKIFTSFRTRVGENPDWAETKDDLRLALSMSVKMADISNCGRPTHLYRLWAKNIAAEFYNQGDAEVGVGLPISPFMDRMKDTTDFPKGQCSFMDFVVIPMFQAMATFLPHMEFCLTHTTENKEFWGRQEALMNSSAE